MNESADIRRRALSGLSWTARSTLFQQVVQFGFTAALARILVPHDFGLIALLSVFTGFAALFIDLGFTSALIQRTGLEERHLSTAFWINLLIGAGITMLIMALAPLIAAFYNQPRLVVLTIAIAPASLAGSLVGVQTALLQREMNFRRLAFVENTALVAGSVVAVTMALSGLGVWSLVALTISTVTIRACLLWLSSSWRPKGFADRRSLAELWGFSSRLMGSNALNYWARNADNLLIGRFVGVIPLAFYNRAYNLMLLPADTVSSVTGRVMYPAMSRLKDDREKVKRIYLRGIGLIALVTFPAVVGLLVVTGPFIQTVYGKKWSAVVPILQILCVPALLQSLGRTTGWIFQSQGRTDQLLRWTIGATGTVIIAFFIGLPWGVRGIATAYACWTVLYTCPLFSIAGRLIDISLTEVVRAIAGVAWAAAAMGITVWIAETALSRHWSAPAQLGLGVAIGVVSYLVALHVLSPKPYKELRQLLGEYGLRRVRLGDVGNP